MFVNNLNLKTDLRSFRLLLFSLIFFCTSHSYAQKSENPTQVEQATVVLKDGAKIFSTDEAFNKQISSNAVILKGAEFNLQNNGTGKVLQATSSQQKVIKNDFKQEVKNLKEKKQKEELKKIKKEIEKHEERKEAFRKFDVSDFPSPSQFISSNSASKNYLVPSHNGNDFSKIHTSYKDYSVKRALNDLHAAKYTYYNNKSLDFCFSQVYSVRPPPLDC
jgi:hypothetical protein